MVQTRFHLDVDRPSRRLTLLSAQLGQFIDHDLTFTPESAVSGQCCQEAEHEAVTIVQLNCL